MICQYGMILYDIVCIKSFFDSNLVNVFLCLHGEFGGLWVPTIWRSGVTPRSDAMFARSTGLRLRCMNNATSEYDSEHCQINAKNASSALAYMSRMLGCPADVEIISFQ